MFSIAEINQFKFTEGNDTISTIERPTIHESTRNGEPFGYMDFENVTKETAAAYYQGMVDLMRRQKNFQQATSNSLQEDNYNNQSNNSSKQNATGKILTLNNGHSILGTDSQYPNNMAGFADRILIALLVSFGLGAITTAIYIFIGLGKVTINIS